MKSWRYLSPAIVLVTIVPLLGRDDLPPEARQLEGPWVVQKAERDGKPTEALQGAIYEFRRDGKIIMAPADNKLPPRTAAFRILPPVDKSRYLRIVLIPEDGPNKGKEMAGVFRFRDGLLDLCHGEVPLPNPPVDFVTKPGSGWVLLTLHRRK